MKKIIRYEAFDGKIFEDRFKCSQYELGLLLEDENITLLDIGASVRPSLFDMVYYFRTETAEGADKLNEVFPLARGRILPGQWYCNRDYQGWGNVEDAARRYRIMLELLKNHEKNKENENGN